MRFLQEIAGKARLKHIIDIPSDVLPIGSVDKKQSSSLLLT